METVGWDMREKAACLGVWKQGVAGLSVQEQAAWLSEETAGL